MEGNIEDNFQVEDHGKKHEDGMGGTDIEFIVFKGPLGRIKLEHITRPVVLDKKTTYTRRIGSDTQVDYVYSETEKSNKLVAYKWDDDRDGWTEIDARTFDK